MKEQEKPFEDLMQEFVDWSGEVLTKATPSSSLEKAKDEISEIELNIKQGIKDPYEYVDAIMCIIDSANRDGITITDIKTAFQVKTEINKDRVWIKNPNNTYSHVKSQPTN